MSQYTPALRSVITSLECKNSLCSPPAFYLSAQFLSDFLDFFRTIAHMGVDGAILWWCTTTVVNSIILISSLLYSYVINRLNSVMYGTGREQ